LKPPWRAVLDSEPCTYLIPSLGSSSACSTTHVAVQTVKLTTLIIGRSLERDMRRSAVACATKPPTYLFRYYQFQRARKQNRPEAPSLSAPLANLITIFPFAFSRLRFRLQSVASCFASVRRYLRRPADLRNPLFQKIPHFLPGPHKIPCIH
jgi:hypothetical protein